MEVSVIVMPRKRVPWMTGTTMELHVAYVNHTKPLVGNEIYHTFAYRAACHGDKTL
jgi:hypothetical protein